MEILVVTLFFVFLFQWFQVPPSKKAQAVEPTPLITVPEPTPSHEKVKLLLDDEPLQTKPVEAISVDSIEAIPAEAEPDALTSTAEVAVAPEEAIAIDIPIAIASSEPVEVPAIPQNNSRSPGRREEVWALLDQAKVEGVEGYSALLAYVKDKSGKGTSKSTIQGWKKARAEAVTCG